LRAELNAMRRLLVPGVLAFCLAVALPAAASAQSLRDTILSELHQQGYTKITERRTLLGRTRIVAESDEFYREIVFNPSTGTILRDYWRRKSGKDRPQIFSATGDNSSTSSDDSSDDQADDGSSDSSDHESEDSSDSSDDKSDDGSDSSSGDSSDDN